MANQDAAFGLKPIGYLGSAPMNSGLTEFEVAACASAMFQNDLIQAINTGTVGIAAASDNGQLLGSLQGVFFTDASTSKPTFANNLKASNTATDIKAFVTDNPHQLYEIQSDNAGASAQTDVFNNADISVVAGASPNFISKSELDDSDLGTTASNLRIMGASDDAKNNDLGSANVNWKVIIIEHLHLTVTGV